MLVVFAVLAIASGAAYGFQKHLFKPYTEVHQSKAVTSQVNAFTPKVTSFLLPTFSFDLPEAWVQQPAGSTPATYSWKGTKPREVARMLELYVDATPSQLAVKRLLPVKAAGEGIELAGTVSENCTSFANKATIDERAHVGPASWSGVAFICDTSNYLQEVVGAGSTDGLNTLRVTGPTKGVHTYFFVYTDRSAQADYNVFSQALSSFKAL